MMPLRKVIIDNVYYGTDNRSNRDTESSLRRNDITQSPLCEKCWQFLNGTPQRTTENDLDWFQNLLEAEHEGGFKSNLASITDDRISPHDCFCVHDFKTIVSEADRRTCHLCVLIRNKFARDEESSQLFISLEKKCIEGKVSDCTVRIAIDRNFDVGCFPYRLRVDITLPDTAEQAWINVNIAAGSGYDTKTLDVPLEPSTSSSTSFAMAADWLSICLNTHDECRSLLKSSDAILPARLIDTEGVDETGTVALHRTAPDLQLYHYVVLSHCWGTQKRLLLTSSNQPELERGIRMDRLTLNFQHAVQITRRLGYRYLWIDCLCIQQDSAEDWASEASKMASIYGNAICCIAASASGDSEGGCYRSREPFLVQALRIDKDLFPNLYAFNSSEQILVSNDSIDLLWGTRCKGPLDQRGWILQEHVLAPRTLHYTETQIFWECRRLTTSEAWPAAAFEQTSANPLDGRIKTMFDLSRTFAREHWMTSSVTDLERLYRRWTDLVEVYMKRSLTYQGDKLPAISGLANVMMSLSKDDYMAGLWRNDLLRGLAWNVQTNKPFKPRPTPPCAPTWSWASVVNEVEYDWAVNETRDRECTIHDVTTDLLDSSPTGRVKGGRLTATGLLRRASWSRHPVLNTSMRFAGEEKAPKWIGMSRDSHDASSHSTVYLFQLFQSYLFREGLSSVSRMMGGMVLIPTGNPDEYQRVGYVNADQRFRYDRRESSREKILKDISENDEWRYLSDGWTLERISII